MHLMAYYTEVIDAAHLLVAIVALSSLANKSILRTVITRRGMSCDTRFDLTEGRDINKGEGRGLSTGRRRCLKC
jgi:hypothetical protein